MFIKYNDTDYFDSDMVEIVRINLKDNKAVVDPGLVVIDLDKKTAGKYWVENFVKRFYLNIGVPYVGVLCKEEIYYRHDAIYRIHKDGDSTVIHVDNHKIFTFRFPYEELPVEKVMSEIFMLRGKIGLAKENGTYYFDPDDYDYEEESNE